MQAIENRAEVRGRVEEVQADSADGKLIIRLRLEQVRPVPGYRNLIGAPDVDSEIVIGAEAAASAIEVGDVLRCQVKLVAPGRYYALPDSWTIES